MAFNRLADRLQQLIAGENLEFVVVPLVAFDSKCNRIGMGGGYYDRTFEFCKQNLEKRTTLVGIGYELQKLDQITSQDWDVALDYVVTELAVYCRENKT